MLDPRWRKVLRDLWLHRARSLLVIIAVAFGLIGAGTILITWALVQRATEQGYRASLPVSATLTLDRVDAELLAEVRALPEIGAARARRTLLAAVQGSGAWQRAALYAIDDFENAEIARLQSDRGSWPPRDGSIAIERSSLEFSGISLGEAISIKLGRAEPHTMRVDGVVRDVSVAPGWMEHLVYGYTTATTLAQLSAPAGFNELQIRVRDGDADRADVLRIAQAIKALAERSGQRVHDIDVPEPGEHIHAAQMDSLLMTQGAFGVLTLLVCAFLLVNLITAMLAGQAREIGVMKTLGGHSRQIAAMYLSMAFALGAMATTVAVPTAMALGLRYASFKAELLNFPIAGYAIPWWAIATLIAVGCLLPVVAAALPVRRACQSSVGAALRDIGIHTQDGGLHLQRVTRAGGLSRPLLISIGNAFRKRQRLWLTLLALATGGAVFLGAANLRVAVLGSVDLLFASQRYDFTLRFTDTHTAADLISVANRVDGVAGAEAWGARRATITNAQDDAVGGFTLLTLPPDSTLLLPTVEQGRWLTSSDPAALVISRSLAKRAPELRLGSSVRLRIDDEVRAWTIVGIVDTGLQPIAYAAQADLDTQRDQASMLVVASDPTSPTLKLDTLLRLRSAFDEAGMTVASSQMLSESRRVVEDHLLTVVDFLGVMGWVMIIVGGMGLMATMSINVLERTREIGVLRAIGARHGAILSMIQIEGLVIALLAWLLALPLSIPMSTALGYAFGRVMFAVPTQYLPDFDAALTWLALTIIVSLLASAWPAWRATRVATVAALNYE